MDEQPRNVDPNRIIAKLTQHSDPLVREATRAAALEVAVEEIAQENALLRQALDTESPKDEGTE
jgi:hypothetical protein